LRSVPRLPVSPEIPLREYDRVIRGQAWFLGKPVCASTAPNTGAFLGKTPEKHLNFWTTT
jgi:hypothetical protein